MKYPGYPITGNKRMGYVMTSDGEYIEITFNGQIPGNDIRVELPMFINNDVFTADKGAVDYNADALILPGDTRTVIISLSGIPPIPPPEIAAITPLSGSSIRVDWIDNSNGADQEDGFVIERRPYARDDNWQQVGSVDPDITTYTDSDNVHGLIEYTYRVGAVKSN